jgi:hypothetical protein
MTIHTFGDSHSRFGFRDILNIHVNELGARLCYTFGINGFNVLNIKNYNVNEKDTVIFCFGEVDCRAHIYKFVNDTTTHEQLIDSITEKYFDSIKKNVRQYKNLKTIVYNVVPPSDVHLMHNNKEYQTKIVVKHTTDIHWKGSNEERIKYHIYFNKKLKELCIKHGYMFLDIYDKYCNSDGFLKRELSDNNIHIDNAIFIKEFLVNNNVI